MGAFERKGSSEVPDTRTSAFGPETGVLQLFRVERTEALQNTPKHCFESNGGYWVRSGEKARRRFRTPKTVHSAPKHEFCNFFVQNVPKRSKILRNIVLGLTEVIGCVRAKKHVGGSGPPKQCIRPRNTSFATFSCRTYRNAPKHSQISFWV